MVYVKIKKVLANLGNRVYELQFKGNRDAVSVGFAILDFDEHKDERRNFSNIGDDATARVIIHHCPFYSEWVYYVWQPRKSKDHLPTGCPNCNYRFQRKSIRDV